MLQSRTVRAPNRQAPIFATASRAIGASGFDRSEKAILRTMLQWWNPKSGELWPSMRSIAEATGFTVRGTQKIIRRLEAAGALQRVPYSTMRTRNGASSRTNIFRINFEIIRRSNSQRTDDSVDNTPRDTPRSSSSQATTLSDSAPIRTTCEETILKNDSFSFHGEPRSQSPRTVTRQDPEPGSSEASNHERSTEPSIDPATPDRRVDPLRAWMHAPADRDLKHDRLTALIRVGVRGKLLHELAENEHISPSVIQREFQDASRDWKCRNTAAVLVSRLAAIAGIPTKRREDLSSEQAKLKGLLERKRRELGISL